MKKQLITLIAILLGSSLSAQNNQPPCGFDEYKTLHQHSLNAFEKEIQNYLYTPNLKHFGHNDSTKIIPVVVHVIHNGGPENISDAQIQSQIDVLNEDFRKIPLTNGDGNGVDMNIEFCLAKINPDGECTNGIVRIQSTLTNHQTYQRSQLGALSKWDPSRYLNIYIVKTINNGSGILGYASFPGGPANEDGSVMLHNYFGRIGTASASLGRTATHEIGHWFGLYHTFNNSCGTDLCSDGDYVCDTPPVANPNYNCPTINSCSNDFPDVNDQIQNYMDYTSDACKSMFTNGQKARAHATLNTARWNIWQYSNTWSTGCDSNYVSPTCNAVADFISNGQSVCIGNDVLFTNKTLNNPTSFQWYFQGGTPATSTAVNPTVTYNSVGVFNVTLVATNANGTDSITFQNYITVVNPISGQVIPYSEDFESLVFPSNGIVVDNPDTGITWERDTTAVAYEGFGSAKINNLINTNYGQSDALILPTVDLTSFAETPYISFRWAYARSDANYSDELIVLISTDCGVNFTQIFYRTGSAMATGPTQTTPYSPDSNTVWKLCNVSLAGYASSTNAILKIVNVTDGGNNLYIDNINLGANGTTLGVNENDIDAIKIEVYPNPASDQILIEGLENEKVKSISLVDVLGNIVLYKQNIKDTKNISIDLREPVSILSGIYFIQIETEKGQVERKFVKQ